MTTDNHPDIHALIRRAMDRFKHVRAFLARAEAEEARPMTSLWTNLTPEQQELVRTYDGPINSGCTCAACQPIYPFFRVCSTCGNKRCPHAADHALACTGSNASGQPGSLYE